MQKFSIKNHYPSPPTHPSPPLSGREDPPLTRGGEEGFKEGVGGEKGGGEN